MCKALTKCATVAQLNLFKKFIELYNIDRHVYLMVYSQKNYLQTYMPLFLQQLIRELKQNQLQKHCRVCKIQ